MDVQERIKTISESFKELPTEEQIALLDRLKKELSVRLLKLVEDTKTSLKEIEGYCEQLNPSSDEVRPIDGFPFKDLSKLEVIEKL